MHGDHHAHSHTDRHESHPRLWWILALSGSYMVAEIVGGLISGSLALLADAGHMAIDTAAVGLSLFAFWVARRPATSEKTWGYYRAEILAALVNGAALLIVALWIFFEAWHRFSNPLPIRGEIMTVIAAGGLVVNLISLVVMHRANKGNLNMRSVWLHIVSDTLGSLGAVIAAVLVLKFEWYLADSIVSLLLGGLILYGAWKLVSECVNVLLEGVPHGMDVVNIKSRMGTVAQVVNIHDLHVWSVTSGVAALSAHVGVVAAADHATVLAAITKLLHDEFHIEHVTLQLDPPSYKHPQHCQI